MCFLSINELENTTKFLEVKPNFASNMKWIN